MLTHLHHRSEAVFVIGGGPAAPLPFPTPLPLPLPREATLGGPLPLPRPLRPDGGGLLSLPRGIVGFSPSDSSLLLIALACGDARLDEGPAEPPTSNMRGGEGDTEQPEAARPVSRISACKHTNTCCGCFCSNRSTV